MLQGSIGRCSPSLNTSVRNLIVKLDNLAFHLRPVDVERTVGQRLSIAGRCIFACSILVQNARELVHHPLPQRNIVRQHIHFNVVRSQILDQMANFAVARMIGIADEKAIAKPVFLVDRIGPIPALPFHCRRTNNADVLVLLGRQAHAAFGSPHA